MDRPEPEQTQLREFFEHSSLRSTEDIDKDPWKPPIQSSQSTLLEFNG